MRLRYSSKAVKPMEKIVHDVLIVGAGLAGLRAAVAAAEASSKVDVAVLSKHHPLRSHSVCAQGGTGAVMNEKDSFDLHAYDTVKGADFLADQDVVEFFVKQAPKEIVFMDSQSGANFQQWWQTIALPAAEENANYFLLAGSRGFLVRA